MVSIQKGKSPLAIVFFVLSSSCATNFKIFVNIIQNIDVLLYNKPLDTDKYIEIMWISKLPYVT